MRKKFDEELLIIKHESGLCQEIDCTDEENQIFLNMVKRKEELPIDVAQRVTSDGTKLNKFFRVLPLEISAEEIQEFCALKNMKNIKTIKNCALFFTIITVISLIATMLLLLF